MTKEERLQLYKEFRESKFANFLKFLEAREKEKDEEL